LRITGDSPEGKQELENFVDPESPYPVIATTSDLLSTGVDVQTCKLIVLDSPINSIPKFKQIIGRGTRIKEEYGKLHFTIMDFRGVTRHFADPDFDGESLDEDSEPRKIKEEDDIDSFQNELDEQTPDPDEYKENHPEEDIIIDPAAEESEEKQTVPIVSGVDFYIATRMVQYIDPDTGKLMTESLTDYSQKKITEEYTSLDDFIQKWSEAEQKYVIIDELKNKGVPIEELQKEVGPNVDEFDAILHIAYNQKPLTRSERAKKVREDDILEKYQGKAREVLEALLEKYADQGLHAIDDIGDLEVSPFDQYGTAMEIVDDIFGGKENYQKAVDDIQEHLYAATE
jgi:type I restriction enzyme R subunit